MQITAEQQQLKERQEHQHKIKHLVVVLTGHDVGEGDLSLEHLLTMHELHQQVAHSLELHPLGWLDVRQNQPGKYLQSQQKGHSKHSTTVTFLFLVMTLIFAINRP